MAFAYLSWRALARRYAVAFVLGAAGGWALSSVVTYLVALAAGGVVWRPTGAAAVLELCASIGGLAATVLALAVVSRRGRRGVARIQVAVSTPLAARPSAGHEVEVWLANAGEEPAQRVRLAWSVAGAEADWLARPPAGWTLAGPTTCHGATWLLRDPLGPGARLHLGPFRFGPGTGPRRAAAVVTAANASPQFGGIDL